MGSQSKIKVHGLPQIPKDLFFDKDDQKGSKNNRYLKKWKEGSSEEFLRLFLKLLDERKGDSSQWSLSLCPSVWTNEPQATSPGNWET